MPKRISTRTVISRIYWTVCSFGLAALTAWQFGWPPFDTVGPPAQQTLQNVGPEASGESERTSNEYSQDDLDQEIRVAQSEPSLEAETFEGTTSQADPQYGAPGRLSSRPLRQDPAPETMPGRFTTDGKSPPPKTAEAIAPNIPAQTKVAASRLPLERVPNRDMQFDPSSDDSGTTQPEVVATAGVVPVSAETKPTQPSPPGPDPELVEINRLLEAGETLEAHRKLSVLYWNQPQQRKTLQNQIDRTAQLIYFSPQPHFMPPYEIQPGDQLRQIAGRYKVPWEYLARLNRVDPRTIRSGQQLKVIKGPFSAVVDLSKFELIIHGYGYYIRKYPVGIGRDGSSPQGKFTVLEKVTNPQYTAPDGTVINGDDPANPLGERWIDLGNSYGIHGTIDPNSIGRAESRGCIRMLNADVEEVYDLLSNGSEVQIRR